MHILRLFSHLDEVGTKPHIPNPSLPLSIIAGHYHDLGKYICGAYLQRRQKEDRISLWTSQKDLKLENETIGKQLKKTLAFDSKSELHYLKHEDQKPEGSNQNRSWKNRNQQNARLYVV